ncbi:hypothetical protein GWK47_017308 [Chionoecetes opilio]|uniref:BESS domain-containing protein n=1 Tax=Chionoecetes opilio TaxID=41210 RepID=A0A8J5CH87_CHIOP|nr:hypothetical protein GWK47_017308 [Chionoecetes opilio]
MTQEKVADNENAAEDDSDDISDSDGNLSTRSCRKLQSLFQTMYYVHHCGRKRTPMHIMNAESVHALGRGGKIVTSILNHEGLALSYTELRRYQHDLASFTAQHNKDRIALPSHFDPGQFTSGAIDNWDHEGARVSEHDDTVILLFQDKPVSSPCKPKIYDTQVTHGPQAFKEILPCQILSDFHKSARNPDIPASYKFVLPFLKSRIQAGTLPPSSPGDDNEADVELDSVDHEGDIVCETSKEGPETTKTTENHPSPPSFATSSRRGRKRAADDPFERAVADFISKISGEESGKLELQFFKSLLPDVAGFSASQKRRFKIKVLQLIDDIANEGSASRSSSVVSAYLGSTDYSYQQHTEAHDVMGEPAMRMDPRDPYRYTQDLLGLPYYLLL